MDDSSLLITASTKPQSLSIWPHSRCKSNRKRTFSLPPPETIHASMSSKTKSATKSASPRKSTFSDPDTIGHSMTTRSTSHLRIQPEGPASSSASQGIKPRISHHSTPRKSTFSDPGTIVTTRSTSHLRIQPDDLALSAGPLVPARQPRVSHHSSAPDAMFVTDSATPELIAESENPVLDTIFDVLTVLSNIVRQAAAICMMVFCGVVYVLGCVLRPLLRTMSGLAPRIPLIMVILIMFSGYWTVCRELEAIWTKTMALPNSTVNYLSTQWCETVGWRCGSAVPEGHLGAITSQIAYQAGEARDVFETVTALGNTSISTLGNDHLAIRKLAADISVSTNIESKTLLQATLLELNGFVLEFGDKMIELRSTTINSAGFIIHEFKTVRRGLDDILRDPSVTVNLNRLLSKYVNSLDKHLDKILKRILVLIPLAESTTELGMSIYEILKDEEDKLEARVWPLQSYLDQRWKSQKLLKDLRLTKSSIKAIDSLSKGLTDARSRLVQYRTNVQEFQACITQQYMNDSVASPQTEIINLAAVIDEFTKALQSAKGHTIVEGKVAIGVGVLQG